MVPVDDCWNRIGISGDRSCPELERFIHCRNCPIFGTAATRFFSRPAPPGYLDEWTRLLAAPTTASDRQALGLLIFRLNSEWLALRTQVVVEITATRPMHRVPHRSSSTLLGMVNLRGQLQLQVSLHGLLGVDAPAGEASHATEGGLAVKPRLVVIKRDGTTWVFEADEVVGVLRFERSELKPVPATLANTASSFSQSVVHWHDRSVGFLDDQRVFAALRELGV
jgi:chemotaxis-related protein WspD